MRRLSSRSSCSDWTTAMLYWQAYQAICTADSSWYSMLSHDPSPACGIKTTSPTHSPVFTGWQSPSVCSLSWWWLSVAHWTAWHHPTWLQICDICPTCRDVCSPHWHTSWMFFSRSVQLLVTEPSLSLVLGYGTVCHRTLSHATLVHSSAVNWKHFCVHSPIFLYFCRDLHFYLWP